MSTIAAFAFNPGRTIGVIALLSLVALLAIVFVSLFTVQLVTSTQDLHRRGMLHHPWVVVFVSLTALSAAFEYRGHPWGVLLAAGGSLLGYAMMLRSGKSWFGWTAMPAVLILLALAGGIR